MLTLQNLNYTSYRGSRLKEDQNWLQVRCHVIIIISISVLLKTTRKYPSCIQISFKNPKYWFNVSTEVQTESFLKLPLTALHISLAAGQIWRENLWERYGERDGIFYFSDTDTTWGLDRPGPSMPLLVRFTKNTRKITRRINIS